MASFTRVILMGNLTRDPELRYTASGLTVTNFGLAVNRRYTGKEGNKKEEVDFFDIEAWDKQAKTCKEYLSKGSSVLIEGRLKQERWEDEAGKKRSKIKIVASAIQFMPKGQGQEQGQDEKQDSCGNSQGQAPF